MTRQEAKEVLSLYRPGSADAEDIEFAGALALARQDAELGRWFDEHCAVHNALRNCFRQIAVPEGLKEQIISEHKDESARCGVSGVGSHLTPDTSHLTPASWWWQPSVLATAAALALLAAIATLWLNSKPEKPAPENFAIYRSRMVKAVLRNYAMTLETNDLNQIRAHLAQRQAPTDYVLPEALKQVATAGCGVLPWQDKRVAMICFVTGRPLAPGEKSDLFLFVVDRNAVPDAPAGSAPEITRVSKLVTASWSAGDKTYVLAAPSDESAIRKYF